MGKDLLQLVKEAGVVGAGGAGFPTHVKLSGKAEYVIVNGAECEPLLRVDQQLLAYKTQKILSTLDIVVNKVGAKKGIIALKKKYKRAIESLKKYKGKYENIELFTLEDFYPAGDEQVTVYEALNRVIPEGGIPLDVKVIVINVETILNVFNALKGKSVTEKYVTVTGVVKNPLTVKVAIGTRILDIIKLVGGTTIEDFQVIEGGPMMGTVIKDINEPIKKTTKGIIVLPKNHTILISKNKNLEKVLKEARIACCYCSLCTEVCPRNLLGHKLYPDKMMKAFSYCNFSQWKLSITDANLCSECRLCEQACIMGLQPWKLNKFLKNKLKKEGIRNTNRKKSNNVNPFREYRKYPIKKLIYKLGIQQYNVEAPLKEDLKLNINFVIIPCKQHIGQKAYPIVKKGDNVSKGQKIAKIKGNNLGALIHASVDGIVEKVNEDAILIKKSHII
ncbi:SLBB domain-containing protein [Thermohalobacter berrensis]|uniref:NADH dehydrogenase n=1 Tax=Thermohalobacter berrensis TaxID=99594 RepID=A0A419T5R3_9FIRM|nr:4Fe-4S dicluster domain-containing protein [Thermohalobacter berrensis]RKD32776.1 NADH dehydrogenase [Thermohalobacter berrensis]